MATTDTQTPDPFAGMSSTLGDGMTSLLRNQYDVTQKALGEQQKASEEYADALGQTNIAKAQARAAAKQAGIGGEAAVYKKYESQLMAPPPTIQYSPDTVQGMQSLAVLLPIAGAFLGGKGQLSGIGAMQAMSGVLEGHRQGNQDRIALETKNFEQKMQEWKIHQEQIKGAFERALQMARLNASAAQSQLEVKLAELDAPLLKAEVKKNGTIAGYNTFMNFSNKITGMIEQAQLKLMGEKSENYTVNGKIMLLTDLQAKQLAETGADVVKSGSAARSSAQNQQITRRLTMATTQAVEAYKAITDMPPDVTTGIIPYLGSKDGITSYLRNYAGRTLSSDEANILSTYFKGVGRNLGTIEGTGVATGLVGLSQSFEALAPMAGESNYAVAAKMAEGRAVIENGIRVALTDPSITDQQKQLLEENLKSIQEAIPYTRRDINSALRSQSGTEDTMGGATTQIAKPSANLPTPKTDAEFNALPKGSRYIDPDDGKTYIK